MRIPYCCRALAALTLVLAAYGCDGGTVATDKDTSTADTALDSTDTELPGDTVAEVTPDTVDVDTILPDIAPTDIDTVEPDVTDIADVIDATDTVEEIDVACNGKVGCPCQGDSQCMSGACLLRRDGSKTCALPCTNACPAGFSCAPGKKLCVESDIALCDPCDNNGDCAVANLASAFKTKYGGCHPTYFCIKHYFISSDFSWLVWI